MLSEEIQVEENDEYLNSFIKSNCVLFSDNYLNIIDPSTFGIEEVSRKGSSDNKQVTNEERNTRQCCKSIGRLCSYHEKHKGDYSQKETTKSSTETTANYIETTKGKRQKIIQKTSKARKGKKEFQEDEGTVNRTNRSYRSASSSNECKELRNKRFEKRLPMHTYTTRYKLKMEEKHATNLISNDSETEQSERKVNDPSEKKEPAKYDETTSISDSANENIYTPSLVSNSNLDVYSFNEYFEEVDEDSNSDTSCSDVWHASESNKSTDSETDTASETWVQNIMTDEVQ
ncbi:hypothetical protein MKS88_004758 [Plasmodium brasilianum]|nr:hypothetical protein MKS88_004758 [Plasmodium brasilianum]SBT00359.1 Plasmodium exported protein, unknown function [Plasmodium malariae]